MARRFENVSYGPFQLRALLHRRMERGEVLVAWGVARETGGLADSVAAALALGLVLVPVVGWVLPSLAAGLVRRYVLVLTDRRLLLLRPDGRGPDAEGRGLCADLPLSDLRIACPGAERDQEAALEFRIIQAPGPPLALSIRTPSTGPARRLCRALRVLAADAPTAMLDGTKLPL